MNSKKTAEKRDFRQDLTNKLIKQIEEGTAPWQKPWDAGMVAAFYPVNATTGKRYRGGNVLGLMSKGYPDARWCTYKQAAEKGWQVRKGEQGTTIEYWKTSEEKTVVNEQGKKIKKVLELDRPRVFYATVFNVAQMDNVPPQPVRDLTWSPVESAEKILRESGAIIKHLNQDAAYYLPLKDEIHLPSKHAFLGMPEYYATALHELGHWTGHPNRLNRDLSGGFGSEKYAREELRAEMASFFLSAELGLPFDPSRHAAYQESWVKALKDDKNEIFRAAKDAEKIADYILDLGLEKAVERNQGLENSDTISDISKQESFSRACKLVESMLKGDGADAKFIAVENIKGGIEGGAFSGEISAISEQHVVQKIGANKYVVHDKDKVFPQGIDTDKQMVGTRQTLQYKQGKVLVNEKEKNRTKDLSR